MQRGRLDDRTLVIKIGAQRSSGSLAIRHCELKPRDHQGEIPAQLLLFDFGHETDQLGLPLLRLGRSLARQSLQRIGGAIGKAKVFIPEALDDLGYLAGLAVGEFDDLPNTACVEPAAGLEHLPDRFSGRHTIVTAPSLSHWIAGFCSVE